MRPSLACQAAQKAGAPGQRAHHEQTSVGGQTLHSPPHVVQARSGTKGRETLLAPGARRARLGAQRRGKNCLAQTSQRTLRRERPSSRGSLP